jgi:NADPH:quinone reductase-like Zn-dependent oxidoreductase
MHAAVVTSFDEPPHYLEHAEPVARNAGELVVDVVAAGLHPRVRSQADGSHYTSSRQLPLIPGVDGVVRDASGQLRYAVVDDERFGTMAQRTVIELDHSVVLPQGIDPVHVAAAMNPLMSAWMALRHRIRSNHRRWARSFAARGSASPRRR